MENPNDLPFWIKVNDETRQQSSTRNLLVGIPELISLASHWYTLYPGDIIMTGTPDGVAPVNCGDVMEAWIDRIGTMRVSVS
ncbi:fumarylacetoacetate hydrolase family protein [Pseudorhodoplanes sinuspersici]|uniref:fumarylacetoacetate hydrolase family protein n=1 Tax=Pseudorhodoplanes sinuspersici TaxID=1235591 RepID=UPI001FD92E58|nr:fumarylacetoacetate hydrolase family protein [Pseudorhodoplanes sinuspersici]